MRAANGHALSYSAVVRALLVVNPQATTTTPAGRDVLAHALASDVKLEVIETYYRGHAADAAAQAVEDGVDLVVAHGGDGTVNEVVNGLLRDGTAPARADARRRARRLGQRLRGRARPAARPGRGDAPSAAGHRARHEPPRRARPGSRTPARWFTFNAGVGLDADVVAGVERKRAKGREASPALYLRTALACYCEAVRTAAALHRRDSRRGAVRPIVGMVFVSNTDPWTYFGDKAIQLNPSTQLRRRTRPLRVAHPACCRRSRATSRRSCRNGNPKGGNLVRRDDVDYVRVKCEEPAQPAGGR